MFTLKISKTLHQYKDIANIFELENPVFLICFQNTKIGT